MTNESDYKLHSPALVLIRFSFHPLSLSLFLSLLSRCLSFTGSERTGKRSLGPPLSRLFHSRGLSPFILLRDNTLRSRITKSILSEFAEQLQLSTMTSATYSALSHISDSQILHPGYFVKLSHFHASDLFLQVRKLLHSVSLFVRATTLLLMRVSEIPFAR